MDSNLSLLAQKEILNYAIENGMIDTVLVQEKIEMQKREEVLKKHPYKIWQGKDGIWRTYLPDDKKGRVLKTRTSERKLKDFLVEYYNEADSHVFKERYDVWIERQRACGISNNTINRYKTDYKRFFQGEEIESMQVKEIDADFIECFFARRIRETDIPYRSILSIFGYMNGVFEKSLRDRIIKENPCRFVDTRIFKRCCTDTKKRNNANRLLSADEMRRLMDTLRETIESTPDYIQQYAILLAVYTGMRVGELAAITWDCVSFKDKYILVDKSEKYDKEEKEYFIDKTKNGKIRYVPMSEPAASVLKDIRKIQMKNGWVSEYVFSNAEGQLHARQLSECMRRRSRMAGIGEKSIHAIRRTFNSQMRCNGVSSTVAAAILGHSERVNENNYTYDVTQMEYKLGIVNMVASQAL